MITLRSSESGSGKKEGRNVDMSNEVSTVVKGTKVGRTSEGQKELHGDRWVNTSERRREKGNEDPIFESLGLE